MARLTDLSTELLLDILHRIPREDLEPTSEASRLLRRVTYPLLVKHRERLEEEYTSCMPPVIEDEALEHEALKDDLKGWYTGLLCTLITEKRIGRFGKELWVISRTWHLDGVAIDWDPDQTFPGALPGYPKARRQHGNHNLRTFRQISEPALRQSILLSQEEKDHWLKGLQIGNQMLAIALLLENLPALNSITINLEHGEHSIEYDQLVICVERAAAESRSRSPLESPVSLPCQNLTTVELKFDQEAWHPITHITAFLALPSIAYLKCSGLNMNEGKHKPGAGLVSHPSSIVELSFIDASMDLTALSELAQNAPNLKRFSYVYGEHEDMHERDEWLARGPLHMIPALGRSVGHFLESLRVFGFKQAARLGPETFKDFRSLKWLQTDPIVLQDEEGGSELGGVASILPASLQEFRLYWEGKYPLEDMQNVRDHLVNLMQEVNDVLPLLQSISIFGRFSKKDEEFLHVEDETSGWRLSNVERCNSTRDCEGCFATCTFQRTPEEATHPA